LWSGSARQKQSSVREVTKAKKPGGMPKAVEYLPSKHKTYIQTSVPPKTEKTKNYLTTDFHVRSI
jgi:hypothetical protein